jgi:hypothetical protein
MGATDGPSVDLIPRRGALFMTAQTNQLGEWDSKWLFRTDTLRSMRCRKPKSLPILTFYHIWNMSHTKNVDSLELRKSRYGRYGRDFLVTPPTLPLYQHPPRDFATPTQARDEFLGFDDDGSGRLWDALISGVHTFTRRQSSPSTRAAPRCSRN